MSKIFLNKKIWLLITVISTLVAFSIFYNYKFITNFQTNFQSYENDDDITIFYTTYYHIKYDTCFYKNNSMNYPYGEDFRFTGCQYHISIPLKILKYFGMENTENLVVPIVNLYVIISIFLCAIFLFLIFLELKLPNIISVLAAVTITFLSPQFDRIGCHITLSYMFVIPLIIYLLLIHYRKNKYYISIILGCFMIWSAIIHPYYLAFYVILVHFYWLHIFFKEKKRFGGIKKIIINYLYQFIFPAICFIAFSYIGIYETDRTSLPVGYFYYNARIEGLLFPFGRSYFYDSLKGIKYIQWESRAYLGIIGVFTFIGICIAFIVKLCKRKYRKLLFTDNTMLNVFFVASFVLFLYATNVPMQWVPEKYLIYLGPLNQFRSMGRFLWLPFYVINIFAIYYIYNFAIKQKKWISISILSLCFSLFLVEDYFNLNKQKKYNINDDIRITDYNNELTVNKWVSKIGANKYQAILPLPYFNIGSENYNIGPSDNILKNSIYVSIKTGLPLLANHACRTSISRTYKSNQFTLEPYKVFPIIEDLPNNKPFLVISKNNSEALNFNEKRILKYSTFLFSDNNIDFYSLEMDAILKLVFEYNEDMKKRYEENKIYKISNNIYSNDSIANFYLKTWDNFKSEKSLCGKGALQKNIAEKIILFDSILPVKDSKFLEISFWINDITKDIYGRTFLKIEVIDSSNNKTTINPDNYGFNFIVNNLVEINDDWSLYRRFIEIPENTEKLFIYTINKQILNKPVYFDNLLIKPANETIIIIEDLEKDVYFLNNYLFVRN